MCISRACSRAKTTETGFIQNCAVRRRRRSARLNGPRRHGISDESAAVPWMLVPSKLGPWKLGPPIEGGCAHLARPNGSGRPQLHQAHLPLGRSRQTPTSAMESTVEWALPQGFGPGSPPCDPIRTRRRCPNETHTRMNATGRFAPKSEMFPPHGTSTYVRTQQAANREDEETGVIDSGITSSQIMSALIAGVESVVALPYAAVASAFGWDTTPPEEIAEREPPELVNAKIRKRHLYLVGEPDQTLIRLRRRTGRVGHPTASPAAIFDKFLGTGHRAIEGEQTCHAAKGVIDQSRISGPAPF